jgi:hypothetical protein
MVDAPLFKCSMKMAILGQKMYFYVDKTLVCFKSDKEKIFHLLNI